MAESVLIEGKNLEDLEREITCGICQEHYTEPKILPCLHYYCKQCVLRLALRTATGQPFSCPECRSEAILPKGGVDELKTAFFINRLKTIVSTMERAHGKMEVTCELCSPSEDKAEAFCRQCAMLICKNCVEHHKKLKILLSHEVSSLEDLKHGKAKHIFVKQDQCQPTCADHEEPLVIYCFDCDSLICRDCTIKDHRDHTFEFCKKVAVDTKEKVQKNLEPLKLQGCHLSRALEEVKTTQKDLLARRTSVSHSIKTSFGELHKILDQREQELLKESSRVIQDKMDRLSLQEKDISVAIGEIQSVVDYAEQSVRHCSEEEIMSSHTDICKQIELNLHKHSKSKSSEPVEDADIGVKIGCLESLKELSQKQAKIITFPFDPTKTIVSSENSTYYTNETYKVLITTKLSDNTISRRHYKVECFIKSLVDNVITHCKVDRIGAGQYSIKFTPMVRGHHELTTFVDGQQIGGSPLPIFVSVYPTQLGKPVKVWKSLAAPTGIAVNSLGEIIVSEGSGQIVKFLADGKKIIILKQKILKYFRKLAVDNEDNIYGIDGKTNRMLKCNPFGGNIHVQQSEDMNNTLRGLTIVGEEVMVCELNSMGTIVIYDKKLQYKRHIEYKDKGQFLAIAADCHGNLYCADLTNSCVQVFSNDGIFQYSFGCNENGEKKIKNPWGLCVSGHYVYVCNDGFCNVSVFTTDGVYVTSFGQCGSNEGDFNYPHSICVDKNGFVYVTDYNNCRVQCF